MKKIILAAFLGTTLGIFTAVKFTGPVLAGASIQLVIKLE